MTVDISVYRGERITAKAGITAGSAWVDMTIADDRSPEAFTITVFFSGEDREAKAHCYADGINKANAMEPA